MTHRARLASFAITALWPLGCAPTPAADPPAPPPSSPQTLGAQSETHLADVRQLTFGGENAEAYWSFDGRQLVFQGHSEPDGCDRIYVMSPFEARPEPRQVSSGRGATTCAYFLPGDQSILYASTHLGGAACPPKPDRSQGYVWPLYESYDIFKAGADGSAPVRLTDAPGYDAEGTVCAKDGSIVFTSVRDGDLELYRMDADGKNVKRLTETPGYDGGAFFNADCTKLVWRASRPTGEALADYERLLAQGLVRPSKLEIYVGNADGTDARQITYLDAAAFAPFFHPSGERILFSTNWGDPRGREFDIWAVNVDGTLLERITFTPGFDGFPMFSPDGTLLAFSSNRTTPSGGRDTNVFVARWVDHAPKVPPSLADELAADVRWLADPARRGRGVGTPELRTAGEHLAKRFAEIGLAPAGDGGGFLQKLEVTTRVKVGEGTSLTVDGRALDAEAFRPLASSAEGEATGALVLAGHGIRSEELGIDDYAKLDVKGKIVVVRRFVPEVEKLADQRMKRRYGDLRYKAFVARERGAKALIVVDAPVRPKDAEPAWKPPDEARLPGLHVEGYGDAGLPVVVAKRDAFAPVIAKLERRQWATATLRVDLEFERADAFNVVGRIAAGSPERLEGSVVIGAHYDHLGMGGPDSLAPGTSTAHLGADDNASGVAALLAVGGMLATQKATLRRDIVFVAFTAEETGLLGSTHFTKHPPAGVDLEKTVAMLNMDMVGRLRDNRLTVLGADSASEWRNLLEPACAAARVECRPGGDGYGPSDQTPFYAAGVPVLHFFTGPHSDYHKPTDSADKLNYAGAAQVAKIVATVALAAQARAERLTLEKAPSPTPRGDLRSFNASLGTIPDYAGPPKGQPGVLLAGVRPGGAAELGGLARGDILVRLGTREIRDVRDLMYVLDESKPGETVKAVVVREGKEVTLTVTFQESHRPR